MTRATPAPGSTNSYTVEVWFSERCSRARSRPSASAPSRTRWTVGLRWPASENIWRLVITTRTGRCRTVAAITAETWWARRPLLPKPPPMCSERTRTADSSRENIFASSVWTQVAPWLESITSSRPPSHRAVAACGSIML